MIGQVSIHLIKHNFDTYRKLLTGRRLLKSLIPAFLKRGSTNASFHMVGKCPPNNDEFIILVMTGNSTSKQAITSGFDVGSNPHVFFNDFWMSVKTSFFCKRFKHRKYLRFISPWIVWNCILSSNESRIYVITNSNYLSCNETPNVVCQHGIIVIMWKQ